MLRALWGTLLILDIGVVAGLWLGYCAGVSMPHPTNTGIAHRLARHRDKYLAWCAVSFFTEDIHFYGKNTDN